MLDLTRDWGPQDAVELYLDRCQVDTPPSLVERVWRIVDERRTDVGSVLDLGAGDGRFARSGVYRRYVGIEIDPSRAPATSLPSNARLVHACAFDTRLSGFDLSIGNPPYVRNQDLPSGWRERASVAIQKRLGVSISGLANAWQYFAFLAIASTKATGLIVLVIPYEWVSRPSSAVLREYVRSQHWNVDSYRLSDRTFQGVLTTSSITVIDKSKQAGRWRYFHEEEGGRFREQSTSSGDEACLRYKKAGLNGRLRAKRGLSPGSQKALVLTEAERARYGLRVGRDVVQCVTSLRPLSDDSVTLTDRAFDRLYRDAGRRSWLIRTDRAPSRQLEDYLRSVPIERRDTATCNAREVWWKFDMPSPPTLLVSSGFRGRRPKAVVNRVAALAVGSVTGIYGVSHREGARLACRIRDTDLRQRVVAHSKGLLKVEVGQLQSLVESL